MTRVSPLRALALAALATAMLLPGALLAQGSPPSSEAAGYGALLPGGTRGPVSASSGGAGVGSSSITGLRPVGGGTISSVVVRVRAEAAGGDALAEGVVTASGVTLLDGRVGIAGLRMVVRSGAGADAGTPGVVEAVASGVTIDGSPVAVAAGSRVDVPGIGALVFFESASDGSGGVRANALRVEVGDPASAALIGQPFVIGHLDLSATEGTAPAPPPPSTAPDAGTTTPRGATTAPRAPAAPRDAEPAGDADGPAAASPALGSAPVLGLPRRPAPRSAIVAGDGYAFPVVGEVGFTDDYGAPRAVTGWHHGTDLFAATGTPVVAVADGTLSRVGVNTLGGNRLWLTDDAGNAFYYAHLSAYAPAAVAGARVVAGQVIGFVGNTGQAITTPPHLHFEIHPSAGDSVNPYPYLVAWERGGDIPRAFLQASASASPAPAAGAVLVDGAPAIDVAPAPPDGLATPAS